MGLFRHTVDSIIADIAAKVEKLGIVAEAHAEAEKLHSAEIALRTELVSKARAEFARAQTIAAKLTALIS
jgi:hypothetical protein